MVECVMCGKVMSERFGVVHDHKNDESYDVMVGYECECGYKCDTNGEEVEK